MTRLYISADLEGATWVTSFKQCYPGSGNDAAYRQAVQYLADEVNAVAETAFENGATDIVVNDSHGIMSNLQQHQLDNRISLLSGKPKICAMAAGLDDSFDAAFYIGYHAKAGTEKAALCHTFHDKIFNVSVNGVSYGEGGINALYASLIHKVPVVLASGDQAFCAEITGVVPDITVVQTKIALTTTAAQTRPVADVLAEYRQSTQTVLKNKDNWRKNLLKLAPPYTLEITFINALAADVAMTIPVFRRLDGCSVGCQTDDFQMLYQALQSAYSIQGYTAIVE